jgi:hypothetical protein
LGGAGRALPARAAANEDALTNGLIEGRYARTCSVFVGQNKTGPYTLGYRNVRDREMSCRWTAAH